MYELTVWPLVFPSYNIHFNEVPWSYGLLSDIRTWENTIIFEYYKYAENIYYLEGRDIQIIL